MAWLANQAMNYLIGGEAPERAGNEHQNIVPYGVFQTRDGYFALAIGNNSQLRKFCDVAGYPDIPDDPRFSTNIARLQNRVELIATLNDITRQRTMDEWSALLEPVGVPCGPINTLDRVFANPQVRARGMMVSIPHSLGVEVDYPANPIKFSETPVDYPRAAPMLGEDSNSVLRDWLELDDAAVAVLRESDIGLD